MGTGCAMAADEGTRRQSFCRDTAAAFELQQVAVMSIFFTSVIGVAFPILLARFFRGHPGYQTFLLLIKCFAAGVILSTSLVHVLPEAYEALSDCRIATRRPWRDFPFSGLVCLVGAVLALLVDVVATHHHLAPEQPRTDGGFDAEALIGGKNDDKEDKKLDDERLAKIKQKMVSQVLEIGIIFHSVIIGVTMGMSQNQCTIRPLVVALSFHQIFEGMGLGGCIAQAGFELATTAYMCLMFSLTTPMGIVLGMLVFYFTGFDDDNPNTLVCEGLLGSLSAGILIYMALVDLIAADFFHNKQMTASLRLKKLSYICLLLGSASMSVLALWA